MLRTFIPLVIIGLWSGLLAAQSLTKQADTQYKQLAYARAAELYERALTRPGSFTEEELRETKAKLGHSYQQLRDMPNAERVFRELISKGDLPAEYSHLYLNYAQALASNGKYREAQAVYEQYSTLQASDQRGSAFSKLYRDVSSLTKNAGSYKVEFLRMNTRRAEFSPMRYKDGLVFVSVSHGGNGIKRVAGWNGTPFLDLYYIPEPQKTVGSRVGSSVPQNRPTPMRLIRPLGDDDYTVSTANDSRTVGYFGGSTISKTYELQPVSESDRFSRRINTKYHEGPATFTRDGAQVIFTRNNYSNGHYRQSSDGVNKLKLYTATQVANGYWGEAKELPLNSDEYSTGHPALSRVRNGEPDQLLYFASDRPGGYGGTDIYVSRLLDGKWGAPVNLGPAVNSKGNEMFPFADEQGNLYFSSDGHPGLGALDIFFVQLSDDGKQPVNGIRNLGEPINSPKDDFGIVTDGDRRMGYFSSNRKNGGTDDDIYRFTREGSLYGCRELTVSVFDADNQAPLQHATLILDDPIASGTKELTTDADGLVRLCVDVDSDLKFLARHEGYVDNKIGFSAKGFSDNQPSRLDVQLTRQSTARRLAGGTVSTLRGRVTNQGTKKPVIGAKVILINECDGTSQETTTNAMGAYSFPIVTGCGYSLEATKDNMGTMGGWIAKDGSGSTDLTMFRRGDVIKIDNIQYDLNKADIRPDAAAELDKLAALMDKYPTMTIEMRSHTDSRATAQYNAVLSTNRARAAVAYLKARGVDARRMVAKGYGETLPLNQCRDGVICPEADHQQNRRTEIKILKFD